jgi:hypothetical protein
MRERWSGMSRSVGGGDEGWEKDVKDEWNVVWYE